MNILNNIYNKTSANQNLVNHKTQMPNYQKNKDDIMDIFSKKVINKNDLTDMVTLPRTIFKGYLCFTAGTSLNAIAGLLKGKKKSCFLKTVGSILTIYGTYNFVKPYLIKDDRLTKNEK